MTYDRPTEIRCAIYTRKSSEEGLEQSFNSLHAQREACEAYIVSQRHEGWQLVPTLYDDGGFSGGTIERPALKRLLEDVAAKRIDTIVVYKVDRLTRSLADFAKIVEALDKQGVSFVSVTQQFNTTTSMGRLTLNVLLSFAQFEREVNRGADPGQNRCLQAKRHVDGGDGSTWVFARRSAPCHSAGGN
jgi:site-specific DNA recombinase